LTCVPPLAAARPARGVVVGAAAMRSWWGRATAASPVAELVGVAGLVGGARQRVIDQAGVPDASAVATGTDGVDLAIEVGAALLFNPTVPVAHHPVTVKALHAGLPVLGETPGAEAVPEALSLGAATARIGGAL